MNTFLMLVILIIFIYTLGFSFQLWKEKNKMGAIAVFLLPAMEGEKQDGGNRCFDVGSNCGYCSFFHHFKVKE